ncbi:efflux RND transporter permease subunit [Sphingomonas nostoxanthinifaciens]|uniref:efflux RND transporter permease subunit n=1 Tax=Sphingomonas nostoxanthinifaciens TaxID=2872652 RepID=UPI001CC21447|nr:efflux RND transporter permease subunit [Sphingomonas nostoxanthinifaciens]UAK26614.1 efflux RND transporter permease subunit [Sphingomonas nostoxanthinifaciens]
MSGPIEGAAADGQELLGPAGVNPSRPFILRPVATTLFMLAILLAGIVSYRFLPLSALPEVDYPTIQVSTLYPGASPDVMGLTVTSPLERQFGQMAGLSRMSSVSSAGASVITLQFNLNLSLDVAEQEVQAAINAANTLLPSDLPAPPIYAKVNPADAPVLSLGVTSATRTLAEIQNMVDQRVANKIAQISGVGQVSLSGGQRPAVRIQANVQALAAHGLSMDNLRSAIAAANVNGAKGSFDGPTRSWSINANDQLATAADYRGLIIAYRGAAPVRLSDLADVIDASENSRIGAWMNRTPAIVVDVRRQPGANVIGTVDAIKAALPTLEAALPADVHVTLLTDRTIGIRSSVRDVQLELVFAVLLVTLAIFLFLGSPQATLIASLSVPLSIVGTFAAMHLLGFSLNNLTLMALTIASGFVVDDAIVVTENIARHLEEGKRPLAAALLGSREIGFTIISLTVSLIAVLIPLLFMGDVVGRLFREFAITLAVTILISAVVALTLVPMLSARWLKPEHEIRKPRFVQWTMDRFDDLSHAYSRALDWVLLRQGLTLLVFAGSLVLTAMLFVAIPKGLFPEQDTGQLQAVVVTGQGVSFPRMGMIQGQLADAILDDPDVASLSSNVGVDGSNPAMNQGRMLINLKDKEHRSSSQAALIRRLQQRARDIAGLTLYVRPVQDLTIDAEGGPTQYRFALQGADQAQIDEWTVKLLASLKDVPAVRNIVSDMQNKGRAVTVAINRDTASRLGISAATIDSALYNAFGQRIISTIFTQTTQYRVILESQPGMLTSPEALGRLYINTSSGTAVPLSTVARFVEGQAPLQVTRVAQFPASTIGFDLAPGYALGAAVDAITAREKAIGVPAAITTNFLGAANAFRASLQNEVWLILAAIVVVYIVLGVLYESFIHPLTILSTLPSAGVGALLALMLTDNDLGVIGIIGIVLLIGIVKKNAIMMIDFALEAQRIEGKDADTAIRQAAHLRFRPIMMTTFAALFAALPMIFGGGMGAELRQPLGLSIAGGLIVSQALTLFTTPVIFLAFERLSMRWSRRREDEPLLPLEARE